MSNLTVCTLGTASQAPNVKRALNSVVLRADKGSYLIDCGEGTQSQLGASPIRHSSITKILITHLHGDHCFGLPGMLCLLAGSQAETNDENKAKAAAKKPKTEMTVIDIYGPYGLARFLRTSLSLSRTALPCQYRVHELMPTTEQIENSKPSFESWCPPSEATGIPLHINELEPTLFHPKKIEIEGKEWNIWNLFKDESFTVVATELIHHAPSFGYVFTEPDRTGLLDKTKLAKFGLLKSPLCRQLLAGESVITKEGITVEQKDVMKPVMPGRKVAILGDCCSSHLSAGPCLDADLIMHESTLENQLEQLAIDHGHSTPRMAVNFAHKVRARRLILNHFSQRYQKYERVLAEQKDKDKEIEIPTDRILLNEARERAEELGLKNEKDQYVELGEDLKMFNIKFR